MAQEKGFEFLNKVKQKILTRTEIDNLVGKNINHLSKLLNHLVTNPVLHELNLNHQSFKNEIEENHKKYEKLIDETADEISNFVKNAKLENISQ